MMVGFQYLFWLYLFVELCFVQVVQLQCCGVQGGVFGVGFFGDFGGFVVVDVWVQCGDQYQVVFQQVGYVLGVWFQVGDVMFVEVVVVVGEQVDGFQQVVDDYWFEYVELQVVLVGGEGNCVVVVYDLVGQY